MEKRILRNRACKEIEKENVLPQPAKRTRRAFSTIECQIQYKTIASAAAKIAAGEKIITAPKTAKFSNASSQTDDDCLVSTIKLLTQELMAKGNLLYQKDQKYIEMMEKYYLERESLRMDNREKKLKIIKLKERIDNLQNIPLVPIEVIGKLHRLYINVNCL